MIDIAFFTIVTALVIAGIFVSTEDKKTRKFVFIGVLINTIAIAVLFFSAASLHQRFSNTWEAATSSFTLLGVVLTAGGAIAAAITIFSYVSINEKLKSAKEELEGIDELIQYHQRFKKNIDDLEDYKIVYTALNDNQDNSKQVEAARKILNMKEAEIAFHTKLKANAILIDQQSSNLHIENRWEDSYYLNKELYKYWEILFLGAVLD